MFTHLKDQFPKNVLSNYWRTFMRRLIFLSTLLVIGIIAIKTSHVFGQTPFPVITTACEAKTGHLLAFNDGFSLFKDCPKNYRRVVLIGETGPKGEKGDKGDPGPQGPAGVVDNETIINLSSRISGLDNRINVLESSNNDGNFHVVLSDESYQNGAGAWLVKVKVSADWKGVPITEGLETRGVLQAGGSEYPFIGNGEYLTPQVMIPNSADYPVTLDVYIVWQGMVQHITFTPTKPL